MNWITLKIDIYNWVYDWIVPLSFIGFIGIVIVSAITQNPKIFGIGGSILLIIEIIGMFYLFFSWHRIKFWWKTKLKYKLSPEEKSLWESLCNKAYNAYTEYRKKYPTWETNLCPPGILDYTPEEDELLDKIHKYFYGDDWYTSISMCGAQVNYIKWVDVRNKVK